MRHTKIMAALIGIGTAGSLLLPLASASAAPRQAPRPAAVHARRDYRDNHRPYFRVDSYRSHQRRDDRYGRRDNWRHDHRASRWNHGRRTWGRR